MAESELPWTSDVPDAGPDEVAPCKHSFICDASGVGVCEKCGEPTPQVAQADETSAAKVYTYPGPLREVITEVLGMQRIELTVDDVEMVADSIEKSDWLRDKVEQAFLAGSRDAFAFDRALLRQIRDEKEATND